MQKLYILSLISYFSMASATPVLSPRALENLGLCKIHFYLNILEARTLYVLRSLLSPGQRLIDITAPELFQEFTIDQTFKNKLLDDFTLASFTPKQAQDAFVKFGKAYKLIRTTLLSYEFPPYLLTKDQVDAIEAGQFTNPDSGRITDQAALYLNTLMSEALAQVEQDNESLRVRIIKKHREAVWTFIKKFNAQRITETTKDNFKKIPDDSNGVENSLKLLRTKTGLAVDQLDLMLGAVYDPNGKALYPNSLLLNQTEALNDMVQNYSVEDILSAEDLLSARNESLKTLLKQNNLQRLPANLPKYIKERSAGLNLNEDSLNQLLRENLRFAILIQDQISKIQAPLEKALRGVSPKEIENMVWATYVTASNSFLPAITAKEALRFSKNIHSSEEPPGNFIIFSNLQIYRCLARAGL